MPESEPTHQWMSVSTIDRAHQPTGPEAMHSYQHAPSSQLNDSIRAEKPT